MKNILKMPQAFVFTGRLKKWRGFECSYSNMKVAVNVGSIKICSQGSLDYKTCHCQ
jgi:hypothetical protein